MIPFVNHVFNRLGYGHSSEDQAYFESLGSTDRERLEIYLEQQLYPEILDESLLEQRLSEASFESLDLSIPELWSLYLRNTTDRDVFIIPREEVERWLFLHAIYAKGQLRALMCDFWHDHFNIYGSQFVVSPLTPHYTKTVIHPNVLGNFRQMIGAVAKSPAMLYYLDNYNSSNLAPNENWARELLELHTLGIEHYLGSSLRQTEVEGFPDNPIGYVDADVYEASRCFTGWSIRNSQSNPIIGDNGQFFYREEWHDEFQKTVLGRYIFPNQAPLQDGYDVLDRLCTHRCTALHISRKLCVKFISDTPSDSLVNSTADLFLETAEADDQIAQLIRHIVLSDEFSQSTGQKIKRPYHAVVSAIRAMKYPVSFGRSTEFDYIFFYLYNQTGHRLLEWKAPDGYPEVGGAWLNTTSLFKRFRVMNWLVNPASGDIMLVNILENMPSTIKTSNQIYTYWHDKIFGYALPEAEKTPLLDFLTQGIHPDLPLDVEDEVTIWRIRSFVGLLCMSPSFQQK